MKILRKVCTRQHFFSMIFACIQMLRSFNPKRSLFVVILSLCLGAPIIMQAHAERLTLWSVFMMGADDGWVVGEAGTIIRWDGNDWSTVTSPTTEKLKSVFMVSDTDGWAVGEGGTTIHWDGSARARNMGYSETKHFTIDTVPPNMELLSPENKTYTVTDVSFSFTASEAIPWISYSLDRKANVTIAGNTTLVGLSGGVHSLVVYAKDVAGNIGSSETVYFTVDPTAPSIFVLSLENKTYYTTEVSLNFTVDDSVSWVAYSLDGKANVTIAGNTTLTGLLDGSHSITVYAMDAAGNTRTSKTIYFTIAQQSEPFPTWIVATTVMSAIAVVGAVLLVYFRKIRKKAWKAEE